jgi:hypothetical protein
VAQGVGPEFKPQYWKKKKEYKSFLVLILMTILTCLPTFVHALMYFRRKTMQSIIAVVWRHASSERVPA